MDAATATAVPDAIAHAAWLRECHGFRAEWPNGRVGVVEDVLLDETEQVRALRIVCGRTGHDLLVVDARDVVRIVPSERRLRFVARPRMLSSYRGDGHPSWPRL
jgi:hypothetical protein